MDGERHDHSTQHDDGGTQKQAQGHVDTGLQLVDVACDTGNHGGRTDCIGLGVGEGLHMRKELAA